MRKLRVALVILLLLASIVASLTVSASTAISPKSLGDALSVGNSRATLEQIKDKLATGHSDIAQASAGLDAYARYMAAQNMGNVSNHLKSSSALKPPSTEGMGVPLSGIGDAIRTLGSIQIGIEAPSTIAKSIKAPTLVVT